MRERIQDWERERGYRCGREREKERKRERGYRCGGEREMHPGVGDRESEDTRVREGETGVREKERDTGGREKDKKIFRVREKKIGRETGVAHIEKGREIYIYRKKQV